MAVITLAQYKVLMGVTDTDATRDARVTAFIPEIESEIIQICNRDFLNDDITFTGNFVPTVAAGPVYTLVCALGGIAAVSFAAGDTILLEDTVRNNGRYTGAIIADGVVTVTEALVAEAAVDATITLVQFPAGLQMYAARMIAYQLAHSDDAGLTGESIKSYSYSRASGGAADAGYPQEIINGLRRSYGFVKTGLGKRRGHYNDHRGSFVGAVI